jgi:hypothetical protein
MAVLRHYHAYIEALRAARLDNTSTDVQRCRRILAQAIEVACAQDPHVLEDFKRSFAARPPA